MYVCVCVCVHVHVFVCLIPQQCRCLRACLGTEGFKMIIAPTFFFFFLEHASFQLHALNISYIIDAAGLGS